MKGSSWATFTARARRCPCRSELASKVCTVWPGALLVLPVEGLTEVAIKAPSKSISDGPWRSWEREMSIRAAE